MAGAHQRCRVGEGEGRSSIRHLGLDGTRAAARISITSTVLQFPYREKVLNLLDTPGHRDFSEDTYSRVRATDAAIMVLDGSKGIESQTRKLFEVCAIGDSDRHLHQQVGSPGS